MSTRISLHSKISRVPSILKLRLTKSSFNPEEFEGAIVVIPPDGGWGWCIVLAGLVCLFCADGSAYCFGIFLDDISKEFKCKVTDVALVSSISGGFYYITGPITCAAVNRYGFRVIGVLGGFLTAISFFSASFTHDIKPFLVLIGIGAGTGYNFIYSASVIAVSFYFERWRAMAMAATCCGSSLGLVGFPPIMTLLLKQYSWRFKFQVISASFVICAVLSFLYRPIKSTRYETDSTRMPSVATLERMGDLKNKGVAGFFQRFKNTYFPAISETDTSMQSNYEGYLVPQNEEVLSTYLSVGPGRGEETDNDSVRHKKRKCCGKPCSTCCNWNKWKKLKCNLYCCRDQYDSKESYLTINRPMYREDIFYQGSLYPLSQYSRRGSQISGATQRVLSQNLPSLAYTLSVSRLATRSDMAQQNRCLWCPDAVLRTLATLLNYEMLKSPAFLILMVSGSLTLMGIYGCLIYAQGRGVEVGIEQGTAAMLLSVIGIANTVGRIACGVVSCFPVLDINLITWTTLIVGGGGTIASIYLTTSLGQILYCSVFGVTIASFVVFRTIMFVEFFGLENLTNCFGLHMIFQGIAAFAALPVINAIYSSFNTFNAAFIFCGISILLSGIILIPLRRIIKWEQKEEVPS